MGTGFSSGTAGGVRHAFGNDLEQRQTETAAMVPNEGNPATRGVGGQVVVCPAFAGLPDGPEGALGLDERVRLHR